MKKKIIIFAAVLLILSASTLTYIKLYDYRKETYLSKKITWPYNKINYAQIKKNNLSHLNIAIIDTGIDLKQKCFDGLDIKSFNVDNDSDNDNLHGTEIAGIICRSNFVSDIRDRISIFAIDIGSSDNITYSSLKKGISKAIDLKADIINLSLGMYKDDKDIRGLIKKALQRNIIIVCASGNDFSKNYLYPASYEGVISVSSIDQDSNALLNNNHNNKITVCAPGYDIPTYISGKKGVLPHVQGSSSSAALVTSMIVSLKCINLTLNSNDVIRIFENTSEDLGNKGKDEYFGYGLINTKKALMYTQNKLLYQLNALIP
jgi:subtilisin family serine protease